MKIIEGVSCLICTKFLETVTAWFGIFGEILRCCTPCQNHTSARGRSSTRASLFKPCSAVAAGPNTGSEFQCCLLQVELSIGEPRRTEGKKACGRNQFSCGLAFTFSSLLCLRQRGPHKAACAALATSGFVGGAIGRAECSTFGCASTIIA